MIEQIASSPRRKARIAGALYVISIVTGLCAALVTAPKFAVYGDAATLIGGACYVLVTLILYSLFKPVNKGISAVAAGFSLVGCTLGALDAFHINPLHVNYIIFFGFYCLLLGYLIIKSTFFPRAIGVLLVFAGLNYLIFLSPALAHRLWPYSLIPGLIAEGALTLWLLAVGVDVQRWNEQARTAVT